MVKAFVNQEVICAGDLDLQHISCPECGQGENLRLTGHASCPRQETTRSGKTTVTNEPEETVFDVRRLDCLVCEKSFVIWDKSLYESQQTVTFLASYIKEKLGEEILKKGFIN